MPNRTLLFLGLLAAAVAVPYWMSGSDDVTTRPVGHASSDDTWSDPSAGLSTTERPTLLERIGGWLGTDQSEPAASGAPGEPTGRLDSLPSSDSLPSAGLAGRPLRPSERNGPPGVPLTALLRFDVSPDWIRDQWTEIGAQYPEDGLFAIRVPVVTGTGPEDFAGSLTYFFDRQHHVRRIRLHGYTGDYRPLAAFLQEHHQFKPYATSEVALLLAFREDQPIGVLRVQLAGGNSLKQASSKYTVRAELNAAAADDRLSHRMLGMLREMRKQNIL